LQKLGLRPLRPLDEDLRLTQTATSYAGTSRPGAKRRSRGAAGASAAGSCPAAASDSAEPDFSKMTPAEKARWNLERWKRIIG